MKIDGKKIAKEIIEDLKDQKKPSGKLAIILIGDNEASESFIKQKERVAKQLEVTFKVYKFEESISEEELIAEIGEMNGDRNISSLIVQLPLPKKFNRDNILNAVREDKDVDCLGGICLGKLVDSDISLPPAVGVVLEIIKRQNLEIEDLSMAVVGMGFLVGEPVSNYLRSKVKKMGVFDMGSSLEDLSEYDLVVLGVGKAGLVNSSQLKTGGGVIDFGYDNGRGDLEEIDLDKLSFYTPMPGGTGPILVAKLFENFYKKTA